MEQEFSINMGNNVHGNVRLDGFLHRNLQDGTATAVGQINQSDWVLVDNAHAIAEQVAGDLDYVLDRWAVVDTEYATTLVVRMSELDADSIAIRGVLGYPKDSVLGYLRAGRSE